MTHEEGPLEPTAAFGRGPSWTVARWLLGVVGAGILVNTFVGIARGRLTYSVERYVGDAPVVLTGRGDIGLGALCSGVAAAVLLAFALAPRLFRRPAVAIVGFIALVAAMSGLDYLAR